MKKPIILITILLILTLKAQSQILISLLLGDKLNSENIEFGLSGGYGAANIYGNAGSDHLNTLFLGFYFNFKLQEEKNWFLKTGVLVKSKMGDDGFSVYPLNDKKLDSIFMGGKISREINAFNVPIELMYRFNKRWYVSAGGQLGLMYRTRDKITNTINETEDIRLFNEISDQIRKIDGGISLGAGLKLKEGKESISLGIRYYHGLVDVYKNQQLKGTNAVFYITCEIPIGVSKS